MAKSMRIGFKEKRQIYEHLKTILTRTEEGFYLYPPGETDSTVARLFNCTANHVAGVRKEEFGKVRAPRKASVEDRVRAIEKYLDEKDAHWCQHLLALTEL